MNKWIFYSQYNSYSNGFLKVYAVFFFVTLDCRENSRQNNMYIQIDGRCGGRTGRPKLTWKKLMEKD